MVNEEESKGLGQTAPGLKRKGGAGRDKQETQSYSYHVSSLECWQYSGTLLKST